MDDWFASAESARTPFAKVLAEIWRQGLSGSLYVKAGGVPKCLSFERGALVLDAVSFEEKDFLRFLLSKGMTDLIAMNRVEEHAQKTGISLLRAFVETSVFEPERLWGLLESYAREEALSLFDVPGLVLEGVRRTRDGAVAGEDLPAPGEIVRRLPAGSPDAFRLSLTEKYVLGLLDPPRTLAEICAASDLGEAETRRILFALISLGLAGSAGPKPKTARLGPDMSLAGMDRLMGLFNAKCAFIFKHVTKEIGPVAFNLVGKALDDVRDHLDPAFQGAKLKPDGRLEVKTLLKVNANIVGDECRKNMLRSMDEILAAEVLLVKRTLGPEHEATLVRNLEKVGETP